MHQDVPLTPAATFTDPSTLLDVPIATTTDEAEQRLIAWIRANAPEIQSITTVVSFGPDGREITLDSATLTDGRTLTDNELDTREPFYSATLTEAITNTLTHCRESFDSGQITVKPRQQRQHQRPQTMKITIPQAPRRPQPGTTPNL